MNVAKSFIVSFLNRAAGCCLWMILISQTAQAANEMQTEMADVAKSISGLLEKRNETQVAMGQFTGPARMPSSAGPAIVKTLTEELNKRGITVTRRAAIEIKGDYLAVVNERTRGPGALVKGRALDSNGQVLMEFEKGISNEGTVASLFGVTVDLPPDDSPRDRRKKLRESIDDPKVQLTESRVTAGANSPYALELLVKAGDQYLPRKLEDQEGLAFAPIRPDEIYAVRIYNDSSFDAAVTLTIDGLNMFSFSGNPSYYQMGVVIIGAKSHGTIYGWHRTNEMSDSFLVTSYAKSAAAELKQTADLGTITCSFAAAWPPDGPAPPDETLRGDHATGRGPAIAAKFQEAQRIFGRTRAAVSVRYDKPIVP